jgi:hypothetical protein
MPRYRKSRLPDGWQIADRDDGHWLQRRQDDGAWRDFAGPYTQRATAYSKWRRWTQREIMRRRTGMARNGGVHEHEWIRDYGVEDGMLCVLCGVPR